MEWGRDWAERTRPRLAKQYDRPVFVYNYPKGVKAFYMKENPADPRTVLNNDCLAPEGLRRDHRRPASARTITTSCSRVSAPRSCRKRRTPGIWICGKYGTFVHSGLDLGRADVAWICGIPHIREAIAFPRTLQALP